MSLGELVWIANWGLGPEEDTANGIDFVGDPDDAADDDEGDALSEVG